MLAIPLAPVLNRLMRGTAEEQGSFTAIDLLCEDLLDDEGFLVTLREARGTLFCDEDFDVLYPSGRGRPSHPPSVLAALLLAQIFYGISDREAERRSRVDLSWKDALGLPLEHRGVPHVCLVEFRARVVRAEMAGFFNAKLLELAKRAGVIGHRRVVDSTGIADSVVTMDTVSLIRSATRHCLDLLGTLDKRLARTTRSSLVRSDYDERAKPEINWSSAPERQELVSVLCTDAASVMHSCANLDDPALAEAVALLRIVSAQDVEEDGAGGFKVREGVAKDRVISTVDTDTRHGHRSRSDRYDGYKVHLSADVDSDLITAGVATKATTSDDEVLPELIEADPLAIAELIADTHYGAGKTRAKLGASGIELVAPAPPIAKRGEYFSKADFTIDLENKVVTCPAGAQAAIRPTRAKRIDVRFAEHCTDCPLKAKCTTRAKGRIVEINPAEELLASARAARLTPEFKDRYRERARIERKNAQLKFRTQKIPWRGLVKADAWVKLRVAVLNLDRIGRMPGLIG